VPIGYASFGPAGAVVVVVGGDVVVVVAGGPVVVVVGFAVVVVVEGDVGDLAIGAVDVVVVGEGLDEDVLFTGVRRGRPCRPAVDEVRRFRTFVPALDNVVERAGDVDAGAMNMLVLDAEDWCWPPCSKRGVLSPTSDAAIVLRPCTVTACVVPGVDVEAEASMLTIARSTHEAVTSVMSFGIRYVTGLWKSWLIVPLFMVSKFTYQNHTPAYAFSTNAQCCF
jgi:hypothetical protein